MSTENIKDSYNEIPYTSHAFAISRPERLAANATLFGMTPAKMETARILELGGAAGQNVIRFAADYPKSKVVCIDLAEVQVADGQKHVKKMGLKNIELKTMSITDIDESFGEFDYIICHGVFSWVPDFVQEKILDICNKNLSENGVAYISYNTLPGWNMANTIRDMMLYHGENFQNSKEAIEQGRLFLNFVSSALKGNETSYAKFLNGEAEKVSKQGDYYLRHEHFSENNKSFYFHQFNEMANKHGLKYLCDSSLPSMYLGNMPEKARKELGAVNDIVRTEQYMDFITNRRFRTTLICKNSVALDRNITNEKLNSLYFNIDVKYSGDLNKVKMDTNTKYEFEVAGRTATSNGAATTALFVASIKNPHQFYSIDEYVKMIQDLGVKTDKSQIVAEISNAIMTMVFSGGVQVSLIPLNAVHKVSNKPLASPTARAQIELNAQCGVVTSQAHTPFQIDVIKAKLLLLCDGKSEVEQIKDKMLKAFESKEYTITEGDKEIKDAKDAKRILDTGVDSLLQALANANLLIK